MSGPIPSSNLLVPRAVVDGIVRAAAGGASEAGTTMAHLEASLGSAWRRVGAVDAVAGLDEVRAAMVALDGTEGVRTARMAAALDRIAEGPFRTTGEAARHFQLPARDVEGVRATLQARGLDVVVSTAGSTPVRRVPQAFLDASSVDALLPAGSGTGMSIRRGLALGGAATAALFAVRSIGGGGSNSAAAGTTGAGTVVPATTPEQQQRAKLLQLAIDLSGTDDIESDGELSPEVADWKSKVIDGRPESASASWEIAFAAHVAREAGAPIGVDGKGAATAIDLRVWAEQAGRFRPADDAAAIAPGNLVLIERRNAFNTTWHDVAVVVGPSKDGTGISVIGGNRLTAATVEVDGAPVYVGSVAHEVIPFDDPAKGRIEGYIDPVSEPLPVAAPQPVADPEAEASRKRGEIVARAQTQLNVKEDGVNPNRGEVVDGYWKSANGLSLEDRDRMWCAAFVSWLYNEQRMPFADRDGSISTIRILDWATANGVWNDARSGTPPKAGDLILFKFPDRSGAVNHVGMVESYDPATNTVKTIEGNTSQEGVSSNGGGVFPKEWSLDDPKVKGTVDVFAYYAAHPDGPPVSPNIA